MIKDSKVLEQFIVSRLCCSEQSVEKNIRIVNELHSFSLVCGKFNVEASISETQKRIARVINNVHFSS